jgi:hypothetical protein
MTDTLWGEAAPYQRHSDTSREAAAEVTPSLSARQASVLACYGPLGLTDEELVTYMNGDPSSLRPRRIELVAKGMLQDSGTTRKTRSGRRAVVWVRV